MSIDVSFTKDNLDYYLKELAKEFKKRCGGIPAELILVGGASIIVNYQFRMMSYDIDAAYENRDIMKEAINIVGDRFGLPGGWLNDDFKMTNSYTPKIVEYSDYYKTFSNVLSVRTVRAEYLIAMKLVSARRYKKDLSDIAGILYEEQMRGKPLTQEIINRAICNLYGNTDIVSDYVKQLLEKMLMHEDLKALFAELSEDEELAKATLIEVEKKYPGAVKKDNVNDVIEAALAKQRRGIR